MSNFDTIQSITKNLETVLNGLGVKFSVKTLEDSKLTPASAIPCGEIFYVNEWGETNHNERPSYIEAEFLLKVYLNHRDEEDMVRNQQKWFHLIRSGVTINALNIVALASSKLVSKVMTESASPVNDSPNGIASLNYRVRIRYREL